MASIFKPTYTKTDPKTGTKTKRKLKKWYVKYKDADGVVRKVPGYADKAATQQLAAKLERQVELAHVGIQDPFETHRCTSLADHLDAFRNHLNDGGNSAHHVNQTYRRARCIVDWCGFKFIQDISASRIEAFLADLRGQGRSVQTSNHYLGAIKEFASWLVLDRRTGENGIAHLRKMNTDSDRRHDRRALSSDDFAKLVESAYRGPVIEGVPGPERAMLYVMAAWTGYRRRELASLTLKSFDFEADPPTVEVAACYSKRRRLDRVPLHPVVVERIREFLAGKDNLERDTPIFALITPKGYYRKTAKMMKRDLERAGIAYCNEDGLYADFHSNRHTFISNLQRSGADPKMAQT